MGVRTCDLTVALIDFYGGNTWPPKLHKMNKWKKKLKRLSCQPSAQKIKEYTNSLEVIWKFLNISKWFSHISVNIHAKTVILPSCLDILDIKSTKLQNIWHLLVVWAVRSIFAPVQNTYFWRNVTCKVWHYNY